MRELPPLRLKAIHVGKDSYQDFTHILLVENGGALGHSPKQSEHPLGYTRYKQEDAMRIVDAVNNQSKNLMRNNSSTPKIDVYSGGPATMEYIIAIMQAAKDGRKIQYKLTGSQHNPWELLLVNGAANVRFNWVQYDFRVDPTDRPKKIVPLEVSDLGPVTWFRGPLVSGEHMVVGIQGGWLVFPENSIYNKLGSGGTVMKSPAWLTPMSMFDQMNNIGTHEYSTDRKTWKPTHKEVDA